jgi:FkbM family methyltransferase
MANPDSRPPLKTLAKAVLSRRPVGVPLAFALKSCGLIAAARRVARICRFAPGVVTVRQCGLAFRMDSAGGRDQIPDRFWWYGEDYEPPMPALFAALARDARVVVDVGANTGFYTLLALSASSAVVHAYEPFPECREWLARNLALNPSLADRARGHGAAVGDAPGVSTLYIPAAIAVHGLVEMSCSLDPAFRPSDRSIEVPVVALDDEFAGAEADRVDLLKVDVEGTESRVIAGARNLLRRGRPLVFVEILEDRYAPPLAAAFEGLGYEAVAIDTDRLVRRPGFVRLGGLTNYLAVPVEKLEELGRKVERLGLGWEGRALEASGAGR